MYANRHDRVLEKSAQRSNEAIHLCLPNRDLVNSIMCFNQIRMEWIAFLNRVILNYSEGAFKCVQAGPKVASKSAYVFAPFPSLSQQ